MILNGDLYHMGSRCTAWCRAIDYIFCQGDCPRLDSLLTSPKGLLIVLQIREVGEFGVRIFNGFTHRILPVEISLNGGSFLVTIGKSAQQPPYRIENRSALLQSSGLCNTPGNVTHTADHSWPWLGGLASTAGRHVQHAMLVLNYGDIRQATIGDATNVSIQLPVKMQGCDSTTTGVST